MKSPFEDKNPLESQLEGSSPLPPMGMGEEQPAGPKPYDRSAAEAYLAKLPRDPEDPRADMYLDTNEHGEYDDTGYLPWSMSPQELADYEHTLNSPVVEGSRYEDLVSASSKGTEVDEIKNRQLSPDGSNVPHMDDYLSMDIGSPIHQTELPLYSMEDVQQDYADFYNEPPEVHQKLEHLLASARNSMLEQQISNANSVRSFYSRLRGAPTRDPEPQEPIQSTALEDDTEF